MKKPHQISIVILVIGFMGCATIPPLMQDITTRQTVKANYARVWVPVNNFFSERQIPVKIVSAKSGLLETEAIKIPYEGFAYESEFCDCGTLGGIYVYREILGSFSVTIEGITKSTTAVTINADYRAALWAGNTFRGWVRCQSKGVVEEAFFQSLSLVIREKPKENEEEGIEKEEPDRSGEFSTKGVFL